MTLLLLSNLCYASPDNYKNGWHWYNEIHEKKNNHQKISASNHLSPLQRLKMLRTQTDELRAKAIMSGKVADIAMYKRAQDMWITLATKFTIGWQKMLIEHPELDYNLAHPSENNLSSIIQKQQHMREHNSVTTFSKKYGLILFYREGNQVDRLYVSNVRLFSKSNYISALFAPIPNQVKKDSETNDVGGYLLKAHALGIYHFPSLVAVDPISTKHFVLGYGYMSIEEMEKRIFDISQNWKPNF